MAHSIHKDSQTRHLYANDASLYEEVPQGVCFPSTITDIQHLVRKANRHSFSITPRSGGTSLAGQATGSGVIMDVSRHMNKIYAIDAAKKRAHLQPGVIRDSLNRAAAPYDLLFGPDTATTNRCMLGGMIGNNSCGMFSIKHKTTRDNILGIEAILSDGSKAHFHPLNPDELEQKKKLQNLEGYIYRGITKLIDQHQKAILAAYPHPDIIRRNTGFALDRLCTMQPFNPDGRLFNMAELLCGSEGTLAMTGAARLQLAEKEDHRILITPHFDTICAAMQASVEIVAFDPAAVELIDDIILNATKQNIKQRKNRFFLQGEPKCVLMIQFDGNNEEKLHQKARQVQRHLRDNKLSKHVPIIDKPNLMERVWSMRKAGLGLLMGLGSDERTPSFCEDTAVRVEDLPAYVDAFQKLLTRHETDCVFYGHASVGELHLRPVVDISTAGGRKKMTAMADEIASLVHQFNGSLSGEHGDGRARAPYIPKVLGAEMMSLLRQVKEIWDPNYIFNPGKIIDAKPIDTDLRISSFSMENQRFDTAFAWRKESAFEKAMDLCNGAGVCRKRAESGGTMCPSYRATKNEKDSTRGRANLFRQLFASKGTNAFSSNELKDALDLCLSCKACKSECPANVDMARMKSEFMQGWHDQNGRSAGDWFFANAASLYPLAAIFPRFSNRMIQSPVGKELLFQIFNIHKKRTLPTFANETFRSWFKNRVDSSSHRVRGQTREMQPVALLIDPFTNYHDPQIGKDALTVLEALGYHVLLPDVFEIGRPQLSKGMVKRAKKLVHKNIPKLFAFVNRGIPIIGLEPSEILTLRDEYLDLCTDEMLQKAKSIAENSFQFEEFFVKALSDQPEKKECFHGTNQTVRLHGHCHAEALIGNEPTLSALASAGYQPQVLETGCCGMAGSFGYEADHYNVSMDIGELRLFPALKSVKEQALVCAPGFSCRHQIADGTGHKAYHPAELIARYLQ